MKEIDYSVFAKQIPDFLPVNVGLAFFRAAVSCDDKYLRVRLAMLLAELV